MFLKGSCSGDLDVICCVEREKVAWSFSTHPEDPPECVGSVYLSYSTL